MKNFLFRLLFVFLSTTAMVFFSEKVYWYPTGYVLGGLILFYAFPVFATMWALTFFRAQKLSSVVLGAALFAFLVEGVLTPVIYEAGLLDPVMPAYFIGWHGLLSVVLGWYFIRKWLVNEQWKRLLAASTLFGMFWGLWATTFWLPENLAEFEGLAAAGEPVVTGIWSASEFGLHALTFTLALLAAHWLLGRGIWQPAFQPSKAERWVVLLALVFFFGTLVFPAVPLAIFKLAVLVGLCLLGLWANRGPEGGDTLFSDLTGLVKVPHTLTLLAMPLSATLVYALAESMHPPEDFLRALLEGIPVIQSGVGGVLFLWALGTSLRPKRKPTPIEELVA